MVLEKVGVVLKSICQDREDLFGSKIHEFYAMWTAMWDCAVKELRDGKADNEGEAADTLQLIGRVILQ